MKNSRIAAQAIILLVVVGICSLCVNSTQAQDNAKGVTCADVNYTLTPNTSTTNAEQALRTPPNSTGPTLANIGLYVEEIDNIDVNNDSYDMTGYLDLQWCDPRLASANPQVFLNHVALGKLETMWWPDVNFSNELHPREIEDEELTIAVDGTLDYREKFAVSLQTDYDLRKFPFDSQHLLATVESFEWTAEQLTLQVEDKVVGFSKDFSIPQWQITDVSEDLTSKQDVRDRAPFSEVKVDIAVQRDPGYYMTKVIIPLLAIVGISLFALWLSPEETKDRVELIFTGVLTSVAYQFVIADSLPHHIYDTLVDAFVGWSFAVMVLAIIETMAISLLIRNDHLIQARNTDRVLRLALPVVYAAGTILLFLIYASR
ncbi:MAG: hypothetical protein H0X30_11125 [Anaerolineae bacterium]|nr:hypothetical protein [Anaerolineae bacterium]